MDGDRGDPHQILGIERSASQDDIRRAFRRLAMEHHPDRNPDPLAEERFKKILAAYEKLSDPEQRDRDAPDSDVHDNEAESPTRSTAAPEGAPRAHPVGEIVDHIEWLIRSDDLLADLWIEGEVRGLTRSRAGHLYFRLAGGDVLLNCAFFARQNRGVRIEQGDQVLAHGRIAIYKPRGDLQLIVDSVQPKGTGVLQAEFERVYALLKAEGLFARKRPLPKWPRRIGVVTSPSGAVWHDIHNVISRRWPLVRLTRSPCAVQGDGAAESIAEAIQRFLDLPDAEAPDLIIVCRGGGSPEDLWAYNEEPVARAIFASPIPVISAVGHETDFTIADYVADRRAPTPSAAAEIAVPDQAEQRQRVRGLHAYSDQVLQSILDRESTRNATLRDRLEQSAPDPAALRVELHAQARALGRAATDALTSRSLHLATARSRLEALNPAATLDRGYALVTANDGSVISAAAAVAPGDKLRIRMRDGTIEATASATRLHQEDAE